MDTITKDNIQKGTLHNPHPMQIAYKSILQEITTTKLPAGSRLQPIRKIAQKYNVSYLTAQKAIQKLQGEGILEARQGDGVYVTSNIHKVSTNSEFGHKAVINSNSGSITASKTLGVLMPIWTSLYESPMIQLTLSGIIAQASIHDWRCELIHHVQSEAEKPEFVDKIVRLGFDGVIWLGPLITHKINIMRLIDKKIPVIIDARPFPDIPVKVVLPDHADLAKKIAQFCKEKQFSRIAMLTSPLEGLIADPLSIDIVHHVREALSTTDITLGEDDVCAAYNLEHNVAKLVTKDFFMRHSDIEVIISLHDPMLSLVEQCLKEGVIFKDSLKLIINVFGIFHLTDSKIASIPLINFFRPAENIGKVLVQEFERLWLGKTDADILDLTVRVGSPV